MTQPDTPVPAAPPAPLPTIAITHGELLWLTFGLWLGGVFMLTVLPVVLVPRLGTGASVAAAYAVFFLAWQPIQTITQRTLGVRSAAIRLLLFVVTATLVAVYVRGALFGLK